MLRVELIEKKFGGLIAVNKVSVHVEKGKIYGLIGPNGSGKTTLLNLVTGVLRPNAGKVYLNDIDVTGKPPHSITKLGLGRTFQIPRIFSELTVEENILAVRRNSISKTRMGEILTSSTSTTYGMKRRKRLGTGKGNTLNWLGPLRWIRTYYF